MGFAMLFPLLFGLGVAAKRKAESADDTPAGLITPNAEGILQYNADPTQAYKRLKRRSGYSRSLLAGNAEPTTLGKTSLLG